MYTILVVVATLITLCLLLFIYSGWYMNKVRTIGVKIKLDSLHSVLLPLLNTPNASFSVVKAIGREEFLQFKNVDESGQRKLLFAFPICDWSREYYQDVVAIYDREYSRFERSDGDEIFDASSGNATRFLFVDFQGDYLQAAEFSEKIFDQVFHYKDEFVQVSNNDF